MFWAHEKHGLFTLRIPRMRDANIIIHKLMCEEQHMHNERIVEHKTWSDQVQDHKVYIKGLHERSVTASLLI